MKHLSEVFLSAADKAWLKRRTREQGWSVRQLRQDILNKTGEDVSPASIEDFINTSRQEWLRRGAPSSTADRQDKASRRIEQQLNRVATNLEREDRFDPDKDKDTRETELRAINVRRGARRFREGCLEAYGRRCAITDCDCIHALEAAHIRAYRGDQTNYIQNGLLLRSDIHVLFDLGKIGVDPETLTVLVARELEGTVYGKLARKKLRLPDDAEAYPNKKVLREHAHQWGLK